MLPYFSLADAIRDFSTKAVAEVRLVSQVPGSDLHFSTLIAGRKKDSSGRD